MIENGQINKTFGIYRSLCCDVEIVIGAGARFPDCPIHPKLTTQWKMVAEPPDQMFDLSEFKTSRSLSKPAA